MIASYALPEQVEHLTLAHFTVQEGFGNSANNILTGNKTASRLHGGAGDDMLVSIGGNDILDGGSGRDAFRFDKLVNTQSRISDFTLGEDVLDLRALLSAYRGSDPVADGWLKFQQAPEGVKVLVDLDGAGSTYAMKQLVVLEGVSGPLTAFHDWVIS
jgi:Ca2+-binding RTX toxin-like protein